MNEDDDRLALLRAVCKYAGCEQPDATSATTARWSFRLGEREYVTFDLDILEGAFADTLLGEVTRRLLKDGWSYEVSWHHAVVTFKCAVWRGSQWGATDHDHPALAVARAMCYAGIISTEDTP